MRNNAASIRVIHCPENIAGQAWAYAKAAREYGVEASVVTFARHPFGYPDNRCLNINVNTNKLIRIAKRLCFLLEIIRGYDILHFHFASTLMPRFLDLKLLQMLKKPMVMNFWGSDARLGREASCNNPYFHLIKGYERNDKVIAERMTEIAKYVDVAIVPDYEIYGYVSNYFKKTYIVPNCVSSEDLSPVFPELHEGDPVLVHCPSDRNIKGTHYLLKALKSLEKYHRFSFIIGEGRTNLEIRELLSKADIVIDQLLLGTYGVVATEAMALGKPVVCYLREDLIETYPAELPIVNANPENVGEVLRDLLDYPDRLSELGVRSRLFVETYHDTKVVGKKLMDIYSELIQR